MSKGRSGALALIAALVCGFLSIGLRLDFLAVLRALGAAGCSGFVAFVWSEASARIDKAEIELEQIEEEFDRDQTGSATLARLEKSVVGRAEGPDVAEKMARRFRDKLSEKVAYARTVGRVAVFLGFGGALIGLVSAAFSLRNLGSDQSILKSVAAGSGGSLICALLGLLATALLSLKLSRYDEFVGELEERAESHLLNQVFARSLSQEERIAGVISNSISATFHEVGGVWDTIKFAMEGFHRAGGEIVLATERMASAAADLNRNTEANREASEHLTDAAGHAEVAARNLLSLSSSLGPALLVLSRGVEGLDKSLGVVGPALDASRELRRTVQDANDSLVRLDGKVAGISASIRDDAKLAGDQMVTDHRKALAEGIEPGLLSLARSMELLVQMIERGETLLANLPVSVPAKRLLDDLEAAGANHVIAAERDGLSVSEAASRLSEAEGDLRSVLAEIRDAHLAISRSLQELASETSSLRSNLAEMGEFVEQPFWKKLGGRKA